MNHSMMCGESAMGKVSTKPIKRELSQVIIDSYSIEKSYCSSIVMKDCKPIFRGSNRICEEVKKLLIEAELNGAIQGALSK